MNPKILHVWQHGGFLSEDTKRRNALARLSWENAYAMGNWVERRLDDNMLLRTASRALSGEARDLPYIKDILRYGCFAVPDECYIVFTNADSILSATINEKLTEALSNCEAVFGARRDFPKLDRLLHDDEIKKGKLYPGSDIFVFTAGWWRGHQKEFPDMISGCEAWDKIMRHLVKKHRGVEIENAVYHQMHTPRWIVEKQTSPANRHNRQLARKWLKDNKLPLEELDFYEE